ncbi:MAG: hypothetical protein HFJ28_05410 [Clostridia bacterium]|nr:hypothetical protein [Clostridia bacterium]
MKKSDGSVVTQLAEKEKMFIEMASNGASPKEIMEKLGLASSSLYLKYKKYGVYTKPRILELIKQGKLNEEIVAEGKWTIEAIRQLRDTTKNAKQKEDSKYRQLLAEGVSEEEITAILGYTNVKSIKNRKYRVKALNNEEIVELFLQGYTDEQITRMAKLDEIGIITRIREKSATKIEELKQIKAKKEEQRERQKQAKRQRDRQRRKKKSEERKVLREQKKENLNQKFRKLLAMRNSNRRNSYSNGISRHKNSICK